MELRISLLSCTTALVSVLTRMEESGVSIPDALRGLGSSEPGCAGENDAELAPSGLGFSDGGNPACGVVRNASGGVRRESIPREGGVVLVFSLLLLVFVGVVLRDLASSLAFPLSELSPFSSGFSESWAPLFSSFESVSDLISIEFLALFETTSVASGVVSELLGVGGPDFNLSESSSALFKGGLQNSIKGEKYMYKIRTLYCE